MKRTRLGVVLAAVTVMATVAVPAHAADTNATFAIDSGGLAISAPASANLGSVGSGGSSVAGQMGQVRVTDTRGLLVATWTATVGSTPFTSGTATDPERVTKANIAYNSGTGTARGSDVGVFTPGLANDLSTNATAGAWTAGVGNNEVNWNPTLTFTLRPDQVAGTYSGTVTHSVN
ncbi:MAG: hypothetical protein H0V19_05380 [Euzebyales bacterium]|nr:hypothetical protein [Euzebyales bacterium]